MSGVHEEVRQDHQSKKAIRQRPIGGHAKNQDSSNSGSDDGKGRPDDTWDVESADRTLGCRFHRTAS
jgi:hypothetical protein